ncbi:MAG: hypothetical protein E7465_00715 [Ruminococcaceae bacterium]|nr:hypothetical protein [Oscillospiraceae bacterium]
MDKLSFRTFTWPTNPEVYQEEFIREALYAKTDSGDTVFSGMGPMKRVITGSGSFFGTSAYTNFNKLAELFAAGGMGALTHPVCGMRTVYFTKLEMMQSPKSDYVAYSFEFKEADEDGAIPK